MAEATPRYTIYLLTTWASEGENASDPSNWRFRLENPRTKEARGFVGVAALMRGVTAMIEENQKCSDWQGQK